MTNIKERLNRCMDCNYKPKKGLENDKYSRLTLYEVSIAGNGMINLLGLCRPCAGIRVVEDGFTLKERT